MQSIQTIMVIRTPRATTSKSSVAASIASREPASSEYMLELSGRLYSEPLRACMRYNSETTNRGPETIHAVKMVLKDIKFADGKTPYVIKPGEPEDDKANKISCTDNPPQDSYHSRASTYHLAANCQEKIDG